MAKIASYTIFEVTENGSDDHVYAIDSSAMILMFSRVASTCNSSSVMGKPTLRQKSMTL